MFRTQVLPSPGPSFSAAGIKIWCEDWVKLKRNGDWQFCYKVFYLVLKNLCFVSVRLELMCDEGDSDRATVRKAGWDSFVTLRPTWSQSNPLNHFTNSWQKWAWAASARANTKWMRPTGFKERFQLNLPTQQVSRCWIHGPNAAYSISIMTILACLSSAGIFKCLLTKTAGLIRVKYSHH